MYCYKRTMRVYCNASPYSIFALQHKKYLNLVLYRVKSQWIRVLYYAYIYFKVSNKQKIFCKCLLKFYLPDVKTRYNLYADINVHKTRLMFRRTRWNPTKSLHVTILYFLLTLFWITRPTKMIM